MEEQEFAAILDYKPRKVKINPMPEPQRVRRGRGGAPATNPVVEDLFERALREQAEKEAEARARLQGLARR